MGSMFDTENIKKYRREIMKNKNKGARLWNSGTYIKRRIDTYEENIVRVSRDPSRSPESKRRIILNLRTDIAKERETLIQLELKLLKIINDDIKKEKIIGIKTPIEEQTNLPKIIKKDIKQQWRFEQTDQKAREDLQKIKNPTVAQNLAAKEKKKKGFFDDLFSGWHSRGKGEA
jgi:hypothetical protein